MTKITDAMIRPEVMAFARLMERELRNNDHKNGWKDAAPEWLAARVFDEAQELCEVANSYDVCCQSPVSADVRDDVAEEAADVANMAMMVADVCGCLVGPKQETPIERLRNPDERMVETVHWQALNGPVAICRALADVLEAGT